jgi:hypothetical protein
MIIFWEKHDKSKNQKKNNTASQYLRRLLEDNNSAHGIEWGFAD